MYHCHIQFYLIGHPHRAFEVVKEMSPLEHFTHDFWESGSPEESLAAKADVIFANLQGMDAGEIVCISEWKPKDAELIFLADREWISFLTDRRMAADIWVTPMDEAEARFRLARWQQAYKMKKDYWEVSHFFDATINHTPNLIWYKDKDGVHEKVNDSFCRTVNKTKKQVEGQRHAYIWDVEQDDPACIESEREVMETKQTAISEEIIQTGEGLRTLTTYKSPLYDLDGSVMGTVGVAIDVTQERAYEQELIKKSDSLEAIFTSLDCGVLTHSLDGKRIRSINRAALYLLGYQSREEMEAKGFDMVAASVVDEDKSKLRAWIQSLQKEGDSASVEYRVQHDDGEILHVMGNIKLLREGDELFYQRFILDCTEQKQQEKRNERRQMELVQALTIDFNLVCFFDLDTGMGSLLQSDEGNEDALNSIFSGQVSFRRSMERYVQEFVHEEDQEMMRQSFSMETLKRELAQKQLHYVKYRECRGGKIKYFQMKAVRTGTWQGAYGIVLGIRSVDEETRNELEQKRMLEDALMQANRASKAKSVFLSNMSHDIRTPMNAIVGFTTLAISHIDQKDQVKEYLKKIMASGEHLLSLINDVLDMSRIESGKIHLDEKPCNLPDILHGLRNILQADIHAKRLELYMDAMDILDEEIYCDKLRLNQVLLNLLSNAVKYTEPGGTITMRITEKPGAPYGYGNYEFFIKDTGVGMSEEFVSHIFEPFEREVNSTTSGVQGTGLGMAITKNIVDMMDGAIEVKSEQNVGTEVTVDFMFRLNVDIEEPQDIPELRNRRALVVDDDFNSCDSVSYMLQQIGMRAEWTLSGKEAVLRTRQAAMRGDDYSVYVVDWMLPDMNGIEITRRIRKEMGDGVSIIVLTAYDWVDIEDEAREAGVTAFCSKPLFLSELRECLRSIINVDERESNAVDEERKDFLTGRILLAEDNELNQEIAVAILDDAGFTTEVAGNGQEAVEMLRGVQPGYYQLVLMDVQMPVMNGYEATRTIRKMGNKELAAIPIIAMTANAFEEDKQEALKCGMDGHISKPIDVEKLLRTLDQALQRC